MEQHRLPSLPPAIYYIPNFITREEEISILSQIPPQKWISLKNRRLQTHPAPLTKSNILITSTPNPQLPAYLTTPILPRLQTLQLFNASSSSSSSSFAPNHCLINEYLPGQGIMPHEDGNAYSPVVATVSLGGSVVLDVTSKPHTDEEDEGAEKKKKKAWRILQEPRSLLVTTGAAYSETLHGIAEVREDVDLRKGTVVNWELLGDPGRVGEEGGGKNVRETRISLTFREVRRVSAIGGKILGKGRGGG